MDHLGYLNSSLYFYFVTNLEKKFYGVLTLTAKSPPSPLLTGPPPPPSEHTLWMTPSVFLALLHFHALIFIDDSGAKFHTD